MGKNARVIAPSRLDRAVVGLFLANGLTVGAWVGSLPALKARFDLSSLGVAALLLAGGICALVSMQLVGGASERAGARRWSFIGPAVMAVGLAVAALSPALAGVFVGAALYGVGNGMMDVSMNAIGVEVEQAEGSARMGLYHGSWSLGSFAAAGIVVLMAIPGWSTHVWPPVATAIVLALALVALVARTAPETTPHVPEGEARGPLPAATWLLGGMALCFGLLEGSGMDWASLHTAEVAGVSPGLGALGLTALSACMVTIRLLGDVLVHRLGRKRVVLAGACVAAVGYALGMAAPLFGAATLPVVLLAWAVVGLGVGVVAPQIYGIAGHLGGPRMLAVVVGFGYTAFLACPALVGFLADHLTLRWAMAVPVVAAAVLLVLATRMPDR